MDDKAEKSIKGYIGVTDEGYPVVAESGFCPDWSGNSDSDGMEDRTCWYCGYADFRKSVDTVLFQSICRHPKNRMQARYSNEKAGGWICE